MSKYTTDIRSICENITNTPHDKMGYSNVKNIIAEARPKIFDFSYPIFDTNYKSVLETKILRHFYTREICAETYGEWKLWLDAKMNEIMPYYNKLYEAERIGINPFYDTDFYIDGKKQGKETNIGQTTTITKNTGTITDQENSTSTRTNDLESSTHNEEANKTDRWDKYSDTPQGAITGLASDTYLTNARHITDDTTGSESDSVTTNGGTVEDVGERIGERVLDTKTNGSADSEQSIDSTEEYLNHYYGKQSGVSFSRLFKEYKEAIINTDMLVIRELESLFFGLW